MKSIEIPTIPGNDLNVQKKNEPIKIISNKCKGKKISICGKIDDGFIYSFMKNQDYLGEIIDIEVDTELKTLTVHFKNKEKELEKELAHEMR